MMIRSTMLLAALGALALGDARADAEQPIPMPVPAIHLSWNAPWNESGATTNRRPNCSDYTTQSDTLYLAFQTPRRVFPLLGVSAVLLFEPVAGDTLGPYWDLERGGRNEGGLGVDFDFLQSPGCSTPWISVVEGHVGYTRAGGRGRLDLSADVPREKAKNLYPDQCNIFARVILRHRPGNPAGCTQPIRITWAGGWFRSTRSGSERLRLSTGPDRCVTWNAPRRGIRRRMPPLADQVWVPRFAPLSRRAIFAIPTAAKPTEPEWSE